MSFSRRRRLLGTKVYPGGKNEERWFVIGMLIGGFFTFGITWVALAIYLATTQKETRLQEGKRSQVPEPPAEERPKWKMKRMTTAEKLERVKQIRNAKWKKEASENHFTSPKPTERDDPPTTKYGPRGGRYTEDKTKDGRPYRRYF